MPQNIEIKAKVNHADRLIELICDLTDSLGIILRQEDTFYRSPRGRLKLRVLDNNPHGQLLYYERPDDKGPKFSEYYCTEVADVESFKNCLGRALDVLGIVRKVRQLYMYNNTRIHLDEVEGLGCFMELEVVLSPNQTAADGEKIAKSLMEKLEIQENDLISVAYLDLLLANNGGKPQHQHQHNNDTSSSYSTLDDDNKAAFPTIS